MYFLWIVLFYCGILQANAFVPSYARQVVLTVQCNEDGSRSSWSSFGDWSTQHWWPHICRICCLSWRAGIHWAPVHSNLFSKTDVVYLVSF